jgi:hypothetical protein
MPIRRAAGSDADALEAMVADLEKRGEKVIQIVGQFGGWVVLTERRPQRAPRETRS